MLVRLAKFLYHVFLCVKLTAAPQVLASGFSNGVGQIWLDDVGCAGHETRLIDCPANALGVHNCGHSQDVGVDCGEITGTTCNHGAIRLQGGTATQGRVEVCNMNVWGTVCDNSWDDTDALVACRQLGFSNTSAQALGSNAVPDGIGRVWLSNLNCGGGEYRLIDCRANSLGINSCRHSEDAGVICEQGIVMSIV